MKETNGSLQAKKKNIVRKSSVKARLSPPNDTGPPLVIDMFASEYEEYWAHTSYSFIFL